MQCTENQSWKIAKIFSTSGRPKPAQTSNYSLYSYVITRKMTSFQSRGPEGLHKRWFKSGSLGYISGSNFDARHFIKSWPHLPEVCAVNLNTILMIFFFKYRWKLRGGKRDSSSAFWKLRGGKRGMNNPLWKLRGGKRSIDTKRDTLWKLR